MNENKKAGKKTDSTPFTFLLYTKIKNSLSARMNFFMVFSISLSSLIAGVILIILYRTPLGDTLHLTPLLIAMIALGFSYIFSAVASIIINRNLLQPLRKIIQATKEVADGNYDVVVEHEHRPLVAVSEINTLTESFNNMAQELKNTELFRNDFIHNFSHEFKTPIISIRGFARQLYNGNLTPEQTTEFARIIMDESERLAHMSSNVLLLSKLENQEIVSDKAYFSLDEQIRNCILMFEQAWSDKNLDLNIDLENVTFFQNEELLSHVWMNLIGNAIKFSNPDGILSIKLTKSDDYVWVSVTDNGIGMDEETASHVFEKFYQGDNSHATAGNGLGLSLVKRIVTLMNGRVSVKSKPGSLTTFSVTLPVENQNPN